MTEILTCGESGDLVPGGEEERSDDAEVLPIEWNSGKTLNARAPEQIEDQGFRIIVGMVSRRDEVETE